MVTLPLFTEKIEFTPLKSGIHLQWKVEVDALIKPTRKGGSPMSVNKYNAERYPDPTAYQALTSIQQEEGSFRAFRPLVYICSPYAGDI